MPGMTEGGDRWVGSVGRHANGPLGTGYHPRPLARLLAILPLVLLLAACSTGQARDARRAQERDAQAPPVMPLQQATRIAERYFPATATPAPTPPLYPFVGQLAVTLAVNPDGSPQGAYASVPADAGTLYAAARLYDAAVGHRITAIWTDAFGNVAGETAIDLTAVGNPQWVAMPLGLNPGMAPGPYAVWLYADGRRIGSLAFQINPPGSAPQMYAELPANPQAPAATQGPAPTQPAGGQQGGDPGAGGDGQQGGQ